MLPPFSTTLLSSSSPCPHLATMIACLLSLSSLATSHTVITYPGWRGDNLKQTGNATASNGLGVGPDDTYPYGMQWIYPCSYLPTISPIWYLSPASRTSLTFPFPPPRRRQTHLSKPNPLARHRRCRRHPTRLVPRPLQRVHVHQPWRRHHPRELLLTHAKRL